MRQTKRTNLTIIAAGLLCAGLVLGADAFAAAKNPCAEDIAKFCQGIKPGIVPLMECLEKHENELTPACKAHEATLERTRTERGEMVRERARFRQACRNLCPLCLEHFHSIRR